MSWVLAICGISGCGKTTLVKAVSDRLGSAALYFDAWTDDPDDFDEWGCERGADYNRWRTREFASALRLLKAGNAVTVPALSASVGLDRETLVRPRETIVVEEPYGRLREEIAQSIDLVAFIDVPMHIALARRLKRQAEKGTDVAPFLNYYLDLGHAGYAEQARQLRSSSDLVLDGTRAIEVLAEECSGACLMP